MASRQALVILAVQRSAAHLLARRTIADAAFLIAWMLATIANLLAFNVASKLFGALDLFLLGAASTKLGDHLQAGRTVPTVTSKVK